MKKDIKFEFRFPTLEDNFEAQEIYFKTYELAKEQGVFTKEEMGFWLKKYEVFTNDMENRLGSLEQDDFFKYPAIPSFPQKDMKNRFIEKCITEIIRGIKIISLDDLLVAQTKKETNNNYLEYRELNNLRYGYMRFTCEGLAESKRINYLVSKCIFNANTKLLYWPDFERFLKEQNHLFLSLLTSRLIEFWTGFNQSIIREIARHSIWRTRWIGATKLGCPLFSGNISEWDVNKTFLVYWSNFYDNIYANLSDEVEDHVIKNDKFLDAFLESRHRDRKNNTGGDNSQKEGIRGVFTGTHINPIKKKE